MSEFKKGDYVQAKGLVNSKKLNGLTGKVIKTKNKEGRVGVQFFETRSSIPKLIKQINLLLVDKIPDDKDEPWGTFLSPDDGHEIKIRIENGKGKRCLHCACDLDGKYYVYDKGEHRCEEHFVEIFFPFFLVICAQCHEYVPFRLRTIAPEEVFDTVYPNHKLPDGRQIKREMRPGEMVYYAHKSCLSCVLCGMTMENAKHNFQMVINNQDKSSQTFPVEMTCKGSPGSNGWCSDEIKECKKAFKRLTELKSMSKENLKQILFERCVPIEDSDDKEKLICKAIVTDKKKGKVKSHIVTCCNTDKRCSCAPSAGEITETNVTSREAPGAAFRNRKCHHGSQFMVFDSDQEKKKRAFVRAIMQDMMMNDCKMMTQHCYESQVMLRQDKHDRFIPKMFWSAAVDAIITEEGGFDYAFLTVQSHFVISSLSDKIALCHNNMSTLEMKLAQSFHKARAKMKALKTQESLFTFMHRYEKRQCDCMKYVATAIEIGTLRNKVHKVNINVEHCAVCQAALARPLICAGCEEVAYCNARHQREHWKTHKKTCRGRKKQSK